MFARYGLVGAFAAAAGALVTGSPDLLVAIGLPDLGTAQRCLLSVPRSDFSAACSMRKFPRRPFVRRPAEPPDQSLGPSLAQSLA
jgi:hypothetical protein